MTKSGWLLPLSLLCLLTAGCGKKEAVEDNRSLEELLARAEELGLPMTAADLPNSDPVPDAENAAVQIADMHRKQLLAPIRTSDQRVLFSLALGSETEMAAAKRELSNYSASFPRLQEISRFQASKSPEDRNSLLNIEFEFVIGFRNGINMLATRAIINAREGQTKAALRDLQAALQLRNLWLHDPSMISAISAASGLHQLYIAATTIADDADAETLEELRKIIATNPPAIEIIDVFKTEYYRARIVWQSDAVFQANPDANPYTVTIDPNVLPIDEEAREHMRQVLIRWVRVFEREKEGIEAMLEESEKLSVKAQGQTESEELYAEMMRGNILFADVLKRGEAQHIGCLAYIDILRYQKQNGKLPDSLADLDAEYIDPFTGEPLIYEPRTNAFWVWSVGQDRENDNGAQGDEMNEGGAADADICYRYSGR